MAANNRRTRKAFGGTAGAGNATARRTKEDPTQELFRRANTSQLAQGVSQLAASATKPPVPVRTAGTQNPAAAGGTLPVGQSDRPRTKGTTGAPTPSPEGEGYFALVKSMFGQKDGYTDSQRALMQSIPKAEVIPLQQAAQRLYDADQAWQEAGGGQTDPTYTQLVRMWADQTGGREQRNQQIMDARGGYQYTPEELAAMTDRENVMPRGSDGNPVGAWDYITDPRYRAALINAYGAQVDDKQVAMAYHAWDSPEHIVNGNIAYVSDEYLEFILGMLDEEFLTQYEADYEAEMTRYGQMMDYVERNFVYQSDPKRAMDYAIDAGYNVYDDDELEALLAEGEAEAAESGSYEYSTQGAITSLIELNNWMTGRNVTWEDYAAMPDEERGAYLREVMDGYDRMFNGEGMHSPTHYPYQHVADSIQRELESRDAQASYLVTVLSDPDAQALIQPVKTETASWMGWGMDNAEIVTLHAAINGDKDTFDKVHRLFITSQYGSQIDHMNFSLMTDMEKAVFNYFYNKGDAESALAYFETVAPALLSRTQDVANMQDEYLATAEWWTALPMFAATIPANVLSVPVTAANALYEGVTGNKPATPNPFSEFYTTVRTAQEAELGEMGGPRFLGKNIPQWAYSTAGTVGDMMAAFGLSGMAGAGNAGVLWIMGTEAAANEWNRLLDSDYSFAERLGRAAAVGVVEGISERTPLDIITGKAGINGIARFFAAAITEGGEEVIAELGGRFVDAMASRIAGHETEIEDRVTAYRAQGVENAEEVVSYELAQEVWQAGFGGVLAGGALGGGSSAVQSVRDTSTGNRVAKAGNEQMLLDMAAAYAETTETGKTLKEIRTGKGKPSPAKLGHLYRSMVAEQGQKHAGEIREITVDGVREYLDNYYNQNTEDRSAVTGKYNSTQIAEAIVDTADALVAAAASSRSGAEKMLTVSAFEKQLQKTAIGRFIVAHKGTLNAARTYFKSGDALAGSRTRIAERRVEQAGEIAQLMRATIKPESAAAPTAQGVTEATDEVVTALTAETAPVQGNARAIILPVAADGTTGTGTIKGFTRGKGGALSIEVEQEGSEETIQVSLEDGVSIPDAGVARIVAYAAQHVEVTADEIDEMLWFATESGVDSASVVAAYEMGVNSGYFGETEAPDVSTIAPGVTGKKLGTLRNIVQAGYEYGRSSFDKAEADRLNSPRPLSGGSVTYMGEFSSMEEAYANGNVRLGVEGVKAEMNEEDQAAIDVMEAWSQALGLNFVLYRSTGEAGTLNEMSNGWYDRQSNDIFVDLNSGSNVHGDTLVRRTLLRTAAHELTHFMERNSRDAYARLRAAVRREIGSGFMDRVLEKARTSMGTAITRAEAEAEVIADASEMMLTNSDALRRIVEKDKGLASRISAFINDFAKKIKRAMLGITPGTAESSALTRYRNDAYEYVGELQRLWDEAIVEAANNRAAAPEEATTEKPNRPALEGEAAAQDASFTEASMPADDAVAEEGEPVAPRPQKPAFTEAAMPSDDAVAETETSGTVIPPQVRTFRENAVDAEESVAETEETVEETTEDTTEDTTEESPHVHAFAETAMPADDAVVQEQMTQETAEAVTQAVEEKMGGAVNAMPDIRPEQVEPIVHAIAAASVQAATASQVASAVESVAEATTDAYASLRTTVSEATAQIVDNLYRGENETTRESLMQAAAVASEAAVDAVAFNQQVLEARERLNAAAQTTEPAQAEEGAPVSQQFSIRQFADSMGWTVRESHAGAAAMPYQMVGKDGKVVTAVTEEDVKKTHVGRLIQAAVAVKNITEETATKQRQLFAELGTLIANCADSTMIWEMVGAELFSAVKNNSDKQYGKTVDFGTVCVKTKALVDVLSETMVREGRGLTRTEVLQAYAETAKADLSVPCAPCYVFARWIGVPGLLNNIAGYQRKFSGATAAEVTQYVDGMLRTYGEKPGKGTPSSKINSRKSSIAKKLEKQTNELAVMEDKGAETAKERAALEKKRMAVTALEREFDELDAYNWVTQVLCSWHTEKGSIVVDRDAFGQVVLNPEYKPVPNEILFDLRKGVTFAKDYPWTWRYRTTRGAGMGKAILPYSGFSLGDVVYSGQIRRATEDNAFLSDTADDAARERALNNRTNHMKAQNLIGGFRWQSTSDFRPEWGLDYVMTMLEMQACGAKGQLYTKIIEAAEMFATANIETNLSLIVSGQGYHYDENGNPVIGMEDFSKISGIDPEAAFELIKRHDNVQVIVVGISGEHIRAAMADGRITFIIPWHRSGSTDKVQRDLLDAIGEAAMNAVDYTDVQNDKFRKGRTAKQKMAWELRMRLLKGDFWTNPPTESELEFIEENEFLRDLYRRFYVDETEVETYGVKLSNDQASGIFPYEYWDTSLTVEQADENGRRFVRYCQSLGITPRFAEFSRDKGYWKLLIDRRMYNRDGTYHHPKVVDVTKIHVSDIPLQASGVRYKNDAAIERAVQATIEAVRAKTSAPSYEENQHITTEPSAQVQEATENDVQHSRRNPSAAPDLRTALMDMQITEDMSATEKELLKKYQGIVREYQELQEQIADEETPSRDTLSRLRKLEGDLRTAEKAGGFASLMNRYSIMSQAFFAGKNQLEAAERLQRRLDKIAAERDVELSDDEVTRQLEMAKRDATALKNQARRKAMDVAEYHALLERQARLIAEKEHIRQMQAALKTTVAAWYTRRDMMDKYNALRGDIRRKLKDLDNRIRNQTNIENVPEDLKPTVEAVIRTFLAANKAMKFFSRRHIGQITEVYERLKELHGTDLEKGSDLLQENIQETLENLDTWIREYSAAPARSNSELALAKRIAALTMMQDVVDMVWHAVKEANTVLVQGRRMLVYDVASAAYREMEGREDYRLPSVGTKAYMLAKQVTIDNNTTPAWFFRNMGNDTLTMLFGDLMDAQGRHARLVEESAEKVAELKRKHDFYAWYDNEPLTIETAQGRETGDPAHKLQLSVGEAMAIWAAWKREHTDRVLVTTNHLEIGGFKLRSGLRKAEKEGKRGRRKNTVHQDSTSHRIDATDFAAIDAFLTQEMKDYADEYVEYVTNRIGELGNEVSMEMFGIKNFTEPYYFPMKVDSTQLEQKSNAGNVNTGEQNRVAAFGATKRLVNKANKAVVIADFDTMMAEHIQGMLMYATFAIPIETMNRVLNREVGPQADMMWQAEMESLETGKRVSAGRSSASRHTLRSMIEQKYGSNALGYINGLLRDINGGMTTNMEGAEAAAVLYTNFVRTAVMGSLSVAIQQPTSIIRAMYLIDPKYFVPVFNNKDKVAVKGAWEQLTRYSNTALVKERGGFDMTRGRSIASYISGAPETQFDGWQKVKGLAMGNAKTRAQTAARLADHAVGFLPGYMDKITWTYLWQVVKAETADRHKDMDTQSEAFLHLAGKRFDEVINLTQVYDSTLSRSQSMRNKNPLVRMTHSFMAEPTLTLNMLMGAIRSRNARDIATAVTVHIVAQMVTTLAKSLASAGRDDDEEKPWLEKYLNAVGRELGGAGSALNPANLFPYLRDAMSLLDGFDVERADFSALAELKDKADKIASGYYDDKGLWRTIEEVGGSAANIFGVPLRNVMRDARSVYNTLRHIFTGEARDINGMAVLNDMANNYFLMPDRDTAYYYNRLYEGLLNGDTEDVDAVREYLAVAGKKPDTIDKGVREVVKVKVRSGELTEKEAMDFLLKNGLADDAKDAYKDVDYWMESADHIDPETGNLEEGYSYSQYNNVFDGVDAGDHAAINRAVKELMANGFLDKKGTLKTTLRTRYRDLYIEYSKSNRTKFANLRAALVTALVATGYTTRSEAMEYLDGWLEPDKN